MCSHLLGAVAHVWLGQRVSHLPEVWPEQGGRASLQDGPQHHEGGPGGGGRGRGGLHVGQEQLEEDLRTDEGAQELGGF